MILEYHPDTDMLYIKLGAGVSTESEEVAPGIVLDFDERNQVIGIEIEDASTLAQVTLSPAVPREPVRRAPRR